MKTTKIASLLLLLALLNILLIFCSLNHRLPSTTTTDTSFLSLNRISTDSKSRPILTAYIEKPQPSSWYATNPLPRRQTFSLPSHEFPLVKSCSTLTRDFPIDACPEGDAYLPWIHDVFSNRNGTLVHFIAQNKRRCHTGRGMEPLMQELEGQVALFQPVAVTFLPQGRFRLASSLEEANVKESRFLCRFKQYHPLLSTTTVYDANLTFSTFPFNYEWITWQKNKKVMYHRPKIEKGNDAKEMDQFWLSQLMFDCPVPSFLIDSVRNSNTDNNTPTIFVDVIPIRTPVRGKNEQFLAQGPMNFNATKRWGKDHVLPAIKDSGRWENIPVCSLATELEKNAIKSEMLPKNNSNGNATNVKKRYTLVACTWTSATHNRRGDARTISDGAARLLEWIQFHLLVGFDHIYVYDNSIHESLRNVTTLFFPTEVTHVEWPCRVCNNNRPAHRNPGERSSQYAAEASCRVRYGPETDWMAFMDPDEYLVPLGQNDNWKSILQQQMDEVKIVKFRSTRARPRLHMLEPYIDGTEECKEWGVCLTKRREETFLKTYNCEYIKSPKPERFQRAMKQIYRPDFVLSHFVHYSTVTADLAAVPIEPPSTSGVRHVQRTINYLKHERFIDELHEGVMVHAKTTTPDETIERDKGCLYGANKSCMVGIHCPDDLKFSDESHKDGFQDENGNYCNCWINRKIDDYWVPKLESALSRWKQ